MTAEHRILCGSAAGTNATERLSFSVNGTQRQAKLRLSQLSRKLVTALPEVLCDALEVAGYVYAADAVIGRGGKTGRRMAEDWRRKMHFAIPVRCLDLWSTVDVRDCLTETLGFLSDDNYKFSFREHDGRPIEATVPFDFGPEAQWQPDEVLLFSGGLDSFAGAAEAIIERDHRVALVSHQSSPQIARTQKTLIAALRKQAGEESVLHFPVVAQSVGKSARENTHRSRSFLFAALGFAVAQSFGKSKVDFHENGVVSLNMPILEQFVGGRATRSTHPQALAGLSRLFSLLTNSPVRFRNPSFWRTKKEVVERVRDLGFGNQILHTRSCANVRSASRYTPHCGRCSQCIDRRFAVLSAGLEVLDPGEAYAVDLLEGPRMGEDREIVLAYVRGARAFRAMKQNQMLQRFPELSRALRHLGFPVQGSLERVTALYNRHGRGVSEIIENAMNSPKEAPADSLLALYRAAEAGPVPSAEPESVTEPTRLLIEIDDAKQKARIGGVLILTNTQFTTIRTFAEAHLASLGKGVAPEDFALLSAIDLLETWNVDEESTVRRRISTLRNRLTERLHAHPEIIVENIPWQGYRLRPETVEVRKADLSAS